MLWKVLSSLALATLIPVSHAQDCSAYTKRFDNNSQPIAKDSTQHSSNYHYGLLAVYGSCAYTDQQNTNNCAIQCSTTVSGGATDLGGVSAGYKHSTNYGTIAGQAASNGPSVSCGDQMAIAVRSCAIGQFSCDIVVTIGGSSNGLSASVSYSATPIWSPTLTYSYTCGSYQQAPQPVCSPQGNPPGEPDQGYTWVWNYNSCMWLQEPDNRSPIVIDTNGEGFHMTSVAEGVKFDFYGNGHPIQIPWTAKDSQNGWLALPNKDGQIASARDLFGNLTAQYLMDSHPPNGFAALAVYDGSAFGGNRNGMIDPGDAIWSRLRVWIDANHDGIAQPAELHTLDSLGIGNIDLRYSQSSDVDKYGNQFRYEGDIEPANADDDIDRKIFDVYLTTK